MTLDFFKSIGYTILFIVVSHILGLWIFLYNYYDITWLVEEYLFISGYLEVIVFICLLSKVMGNGFISIEKTSLKYYTTAAILGLAFVFIQTPLNIVYNYLLNDSYNIVYSFSFSKVLTLRTLSSVIFFPIVEEFFFRKFIQGSVLRNLPSYWAILLSAILFASIHLPFSNLFYDLQLDLHHAYITFFGGLVAATLYSKSKSIGPAILLHTCWNLGVVIF